LKVAVWYAEAGRNLERLQRARATIAVGKLSGAVVTSPRRTELEAEVCRELGLEAAPVSTQIVQRDRHAEFCAMLAWPPRRWRRSPWSARLQRTEVLEAQEPFGEGQKGSSAMPHKRNRSWPSASAGWRAWSGPTRGGARERGPVARARHQPLVGRARDPADSTIVLDYLLHLTTFIVEGLDVDTARMTENLELSHGLVYSQRVLLKLTDTGLPRQVAYEIVQRHAMRA